MEIVILSQTKIAWSAEAHKRMSKIPFFIRPFVKRRIETVARQRSVEIITEPLVDELKNKEMP